MTRKDRVADESAIGHNLRRRIGLEGRKNEPPLLTLFRRMHEIEKRALQGSLDPSVIADELQKVMENCPKTLLQLSERHLQPELRRWESRLRKIPNSEVHTPYRSPWSKYKGICADCGFVDGLFIHCIVCPPDELQTNESGYVSIQFHRGNVVEVEYVSNFPELEGIPDGVKGTWEELGNLFLSGIAKLQRERGWL